MWLATIALALAVLGFGTLAARRWRGARHVDLGRMSQRWLAEYEAGSR